MLQRRYGDFSARRPTAKDNRMRSSIEDKAFLILIVVVSLAFGWILTSFYGAILRGVVSAIMLCLLFLLFGDGSALSQRIMKAIPLRAELHDELLEKFTVVIRATVSASCPARII